MMVARMRRLGVNLIVPVRPDAIAIGNLTGCVADAWPDQDIVRKTVVPSHAATVRSKWLREAEYYLRKHRNGKNARYGVVTCGPRIYFNPENPEAFDEECREQLRIARTNMRRWRNESKENYGIEFVLTVLEAAVDGNSVHLHFNVIYIPPNLTGGRWQKWLRWSSSRLGAWWKDCGRIKELKEVIKYATKLLGQDSLESLDDSQFGQLFNLLDGLTTVLAHDKFADWRRWLEEEGKKIIRLPINGRLVIFDKRKRERDERELTPGNDQTAPVENRILTRQVPRPFGSEVIEPVTIVQHFTENPTTEAGRKGLAIIREQMAQAEKWAAGNGYIVHTIQPSVQPPDTGGRDANVSGGRISHPDTGRSGLPDVRASIPPRHDPMKGRLRAEPPPPYQPKQREKRKPFPHLCAYYVQGGQWQRMRRFAQGWCIDRGAALEPVRSDARRTMPAGATAAFLGRDGKWSWTTQGPVQRPVVEAGR